VSSALAIASVTAVLRNLLDNGVINDQVVSSVGNVTVSAIAPDLVPIDANAASRLNLFLYHVTPNQGWRNVGLPSRSSNGDRLSNPPLALDLHYFLTAYASRDLHAEILLGHGMQVLHETPVLAREGIRRALGVANLIADPQNHLPPDLERIALSGLDEQVESIKITPEALGTEELSRLWAAFQTHYRPSAGYLASVVLIESQRSTRAPLPVGARKLYVVQFREPVVDRVLALPVESPAASAGSLPILSRHQLSVRGRQLRGPRTTIRVDGIVAPNPISVEDDAIVVSLPPALESGVHALQVVHEQLMGDPLVPHTGVSSNLAPFVLHPEIMSPPVFTPATGQGFVRVSVDPAVGPRQQLLLLLNERFVVSSPAPDPLPVPRAYSFAAPSRAGDSPAGPSSEIDVPIAGVGAGTYLVRVQVDGAESPLGTDSAGMYASPAVTIP
jgi:uncharacterized protein DUF4255